MTKKEFITEYEKMSDEEKNRAISLQETKGELEPISFKTINDMIIYHEKLIADSLFQIDAGLWYAKEALEVKNKNNGIPTKENTEISDK
jgi:hypothetical protein